jgi:hypothetical protein
VTDLTTTDGELRPADPAEILPAIEDSYSNVIMLCFFIVNRWR